jgi:proteasome lid subunit RPN8/RPN11
VAASDHHVPADAPRGELLIRSHVLEAIRAHALAAAPDECCGLLIGNQESIAAAWPARNAHPTPRTRYLVDPQDHFTAIRQARAESLDVVGAYHSHPATPAEPSPTDIAENRDQQLICLIVSLREPGQPVRAFRLDGSVARPLALVVQDA